MGRARHLRAWRGALRGGSTVHDDFLPSHTPHGNDQRWELKEATVSSSCSSSLPLYSQDPPFSLELFRRNVGLLGPWVCIGRSRGSEDLRVLRYVGVSEAGTGIVGSRWHRDPDKSEKSDSPQKFCRKRENFHLPHTLLDWPPVVLLWRLGIEQKPSFP